MNDSSTSTIRRLGEQKDVESLLQLWNSVEVQQSDSLRFRVIQNLPPSLDDHRIARVATDACHSWTRKGRTSANALELDTQ